ncbi:aldehyde dehydrogenase family protein [Rhodococcus qingshengii]|uniref:aldehyde dehydrogenase family protein n=1 Tax=Rhodococcus qingshengii TaxID=334542 RepID=UPI00237CEB24|nr:aldehyde dehydrogenase family protein [Rhodococcus qingshengii]WCT06030.1 aldehyde dehydrogenase family protein [Rhodococcus qingshengii]
MTQTDTITAATIGGDGSTPPAPSDSFVTLNPRDQSVIAEFPIFDSGQVDDVVRRARESADWWAQLGHSRRKHYLGRWRRHLVDHYNELAELIVLENGKSKADAELEIALGIAQLHWATNNAGRVLRRRRVEPGMLMFNHAATIEYLPLGVVAVIGPWNYPVFSPLGAIAYALAAGNAVIHKPSEYTTAVGQWLVDSFATAINDDGRALTPLHLVTGTGPTGDALCRSGVDKVAFTGSTPTGKKVMASCADSLTPVLLECGGKDALVVDVDADISAAADAAVWGSMTNAGQTCIGIERVYVHDAVADDFMGAVAEKAQRLRAGSDPALDLGAITMPGQVDIIERHINDAIAAGGSPLVGGPESVARPFVSPVVIADVPEDSAAVREETFGPLVVINRVRSMDEAVVRVNASEFGLGATVFSRKLGPEIARRLRVGMVSVNSVLAYGAMPALPFGGVGQSGFGRIHGADGLREFSRAQSVARRFAPAPVMVTTFDKPGWSMRAMVTMVKTLYR